jgi:hypothetical protein
VTFSKFICHLYFKKGDILKPLCRLYLNKGGKTELLSGFAKGKLPLEMKE